MSEKKEEKKEHSLENRKGKILDMIKLWFKNPFNQIFFGILLLAFAIRLFYFFMAGQQPLWFDEAEYMAQAKRMAFGYDYWYWKASPRKPILMSFIFSLLYKVGFAEGFFRVLMLLTSFLGVYLTYVVGRDFFNKKVGLIAAFLTSIWWVHLFFTVRLLTWLPASTLLLASLHFFYRGYVRKQGAKFIWLFGIFFTLAFLMRVTAGIFIIPFAIYIILEEKWRFVLNKNLWIAAAFAFILLIPFYFWLASNYPQDPIGQFIGLKYGRFQVGTSAGEEMGAMGFRGIIAYVSDLPTNSLMMPFFLLLLFGLAVVLIDLILGLDLVFKKEYQHLRTYIFAIIWFLLPMFAYGYTRSYVEQRDLMSYSVFMFSVMGVGAMKLYDMVKRYNKIIALLAVLGLLVLGAYPQLTYGYSLINQKKGSYGPIKEAGLWLKQYGDPGDYVSTKSIPQINYYSELNGYEIPSKPEEEAMDEMAQRNVRFFAPSTFEPSWLTAPWSYAWGQNHPEIARLVWYWADDPNNPQQFVLIYELDWSNYTFSSNNTNISE